MTRDCFLPPEVGCPPLWPWWVQVGLVVLGVAVIVWGMWRRSRK